MKLKYSKLILFCLRLIFYLSILVLLAIHPAIAISFDRIGIIQWFVIVPLAAIFAFFLGSREQGVGANSNEQKTTNNAFLSPVHCPLSPKKLIIPCITLIVLSLIAGGISLNALVPFLAGCISFILTLLLFRYPRFGKLSYMEPFFLVWICIRLLSLSRSTEEIAAGAAALTQFLLVWSMVVFLLHNAVIYLCLYPDSKKGAAKEGAFFLLGAAAVLLILLMVLPPDFIRNTIVENLNNDRAPKLIDEDSDRGIPNESRRQGRRNRPGDTNGKKPGLRGMSESDWQTRSGRGRGTGESSEENLQYMVKVVATKIEPLYMGDVFRTKLDPAEGFTAGGSEPLNSLSQQRFFVTWHNYESNYDIGRARFEITSLSTLTQKYFPYWPLSIDPTILSEDSGPLRYIHQLTSRVHTGEPMDLILTPSRKLNRSEEYLLSQAMEVPLDEDDILLFQTWLDNARLKWQQVRSNYLSRNYQIEEDELYDNEIDNNINDFLEDIHAILTGFSDYQYNLSYDDDASVDMIKNFLFETFDGDCVEFSNSAALLGRIAGIPSRVVTGYLVAESLQTEAHLRGLANLQRQIPALQQFQFDDLFMVTNLHSHSWVQFYIPDYGWLDFEATQFAIPPIGTGDFNSWDVVIPVINDKRVISNLRKFPWMAVLRTMGWMAAAALVLAYGLRYGREILLFSRSQNGGRDGARALYLLLLARLAADGKPIKPASKTATEYTELFYLTQRHGGTAEFNVHLDHFKNFAALYSELRWREFEDKNEMNLKFDLLKNEYQNILNSAKRKGFGWRIIRIISLRGLAYL